MKKILIDIVTDDQSSHEEANKLASLIKEAVKSEGNPQIDPYPKFEGSYKLGFSVTIKNSDKSIEECIILSELICQPWLTWYDSNEHVVEMIFNRSDRSDFSSNKFTPVRWGHIQIGEVE